MGPFSNFLKKLEYFVCSDNYPEPDTYWVRLQNALILQQRFVFVEEDQQ